MTHDKSRDLEDGEGPSIFSMRTYVRATVERRLAKIAASNHPDTETPLYTEIQVDLIDIRVFTVI